MLERVKHERTVDIYGHVTCLRAQRNYMVQTEDQYIFIHDALLEAVQSGNTEISARHLYAHIQKLTQPLTDGSCGMESEFKVRDGELGLTVAALHQGAPGQMTWLEDPPSWLRPAYCFALLQ